jgi:GH25 family lysozyme M1 (1,4-beta-N-acetylmuramidase)
MGIQHFDPTKVNGTDVSRWDDAPSTPQHVNFIRMKNAGAAFVGIKTSQAKYLDQDFVLNWHTAKLGGLYRLPYHYLDWTATGKEQGQFAAGVLKADPGEIPFCVDFEERHNVPSVAVARQALADCLTEAKPLYPGKKLIIYTTPSYWAEFGSPDPWWLQFDLWIANVDISKPWIPKPWTTYKFWQWTWHGDGITLGGEAKDMDLNVFNGTKQDLDTYCKGYTPEPIIACPYCGHLLGPGWSYTKP